jgi:hypothetical protein
LRFAPPTRTRICPPLALTHLLLILFPTAPAVIGLRDPPRHQFTRNTIRPTLLTHARLSGGFGADQQATSSCFTFRAARRPRAQSASALSSTHFAASGPPYQLRFATHQIRPPSLLPSFPPLRTSPPQTALHTTPFLVYKTFSLSNSTLGARNIRRQQQPTLSTIVSAQGSASGRQVHLSHLIPRLP